MAEPSASKKSVKISGGTVEKSMKSPSSVSGQLTSLPPAPM